MSVRKNCRTVVALLIAATCVVAFGQTDADREVLADLSDGMIVMPGGSTEATLEELAYCDPKLNDFLAGSGVELIRENRGLWGC